jgi:DNA-binding transcriptional regulator YiaG
MLQLRLLTIYQRTIRHPKPWVSAHFRQLRNYPANPKTLGEYVRKKRIDMQLSMSQLGELLGLGVTDSAIEKWEKNQNRPTEPYRTRIIQFVGFDPEMANPIGTT